MIESTERTKPSKKLLDALKALKKFDERFYLNLTEKERRLEYEKEDKIRDLGRKEGLSFEYIDDLLEIQIVQIAYKNKLVYDYYVLKRLET